MVSSRDADLILPRRTASAFIVVVFSLQTVIALLLERIAFHFGWVPLDWQYPIHIWIVALSVLLNGVSVRGVFTKRRVVLGRGGQVLPKPKVQQF